MLKDPNAHIIHKTSWQDYFLLSLTSPQIASLAEPGQFIMVRINQSPYPLLRRPFSIFNAEKNNIAVFFRKTGTGTNLLSEKDKGDFLDIIGPLGKGFTIKKRGQGSTVALIGGGRGIAPLYFLAHRLSTLGINVKIYYGGKSMPDLPLKVRMEKEGFALFCSTEDGSCGFKGMITEAFESELAALKPACIYACGPEAMLRKVSQTAKENEIPAELSLESVMGCGFGACWGCVKKIKKESDTGWTKICEEGPVLSADKIVWE